MSVMCTESHLPAAHPAVRAYRDEAMALCRRHGQNPRDVGWVEYDLIDIPLLRFGRYLNRDGRHYLACEHDPPYHRHRDDDDHDCQLAMVTVEHALIGELPWWWRPVRDGEGNTEWISSGWPE